MMMNVHSLEGQLLVIKRVYHVPLFCNYSINCTIKF